MGDRKELSARHDEVDGTRERIPWSTGARSVASIDFFGVERTNAAGCAPLAFFSFFMIRTLFVADIVFPYSLLLPGSVARSKSGLESGMEAKK